MVVLFFHVNSIIRLSLHYTVIVPVGSHLQVSNEDIYVLHTNEEEIAALQEAMAKDAEAVSPATIPPLRCHCKHLSLLSPGAWVCTASRIRFFSGARFDHVVAVGKCRMCVLHA